MTIYNSNALSHPALVLHQGENNAFQCHGANSTAQNGKDSGGPVACGSIADNTGCALSESKRWHIGRLDSVASSL